MLIKATVTFQGKLQVAQVLRNKFFLIDLGIEDHHEGQLVAQVVDQKHPMVSTQYALFG
jgi:hypothetical protein